MQPFMILKGSRKSISVWGPCLCFASPSLLLFFFFIPSLLSVSLSLSLPLSLPPSPLSYHLHLRLHHHLSHFFTNHHHHSSFRFFNFFLILSFVFHFSPCQTRNCHFLAVFMKFSCHLSLRWTRKRSKIRLSH